VASEAGSCQLSAGGGEREAERERERGREREREKEEILHTYYSSKIGVSN
jgi:hypothetical protein